MIKIEDKGITDILENIRKQVGANKKKFTPQLSPVIIDIDVTKEEFVASFHPSGFLIQNGHPVFAYIRDHTNIMDADTSNPNNFRKIHFTFCSTLQDMSSKGRFASRYRITNRDDNKYYVDFQTGESEVKLYPCKNCLEKLAYQCYSNMCDPNTKEKIVKNFNAKEALDLIKECFDIFQLETKVLKRENRSARYASNHDVISKGFRGSKKYSCEICRVNLSSNRNLCDMHHIDGDKRNNRYENLQCLCKLCHKKQHAHYQVNSSITSTIKKLRIEQNVSN